MKQRFYLYRRGETFYLQDSRTGKQQSLETKDRKAALRLLEIKRQTVADPGFNQFILKSCLTTQDPLLGKRTWQSVMEQMQTHGKESTRTRCARAMQSRAFDALRHVKLVETTAEDFVTILNGGKVSVAHYLKRLHNLAVGLGWLAFPVLAPRLWPKPRFKSKRGITASEHQRILAVEKNPERSLFYQLLWEIGSSQSDAAMLTAENIDWQTRSLTYFRMKTGEQAQLAISKSMAAILEQLPTTGPLFPKITATIDNARSAEFYRRCKLLGIEGVTLHSYRYAWAERAKTCGYPERFAQAALGHNSKAVHRAYAKKAYVLIPTLEDYERRMATAAAPVVLPLAAAAA
ncbi:MAG TPA: tyrosine-type recombinase/integrase [Candidatus Baltobacteraceae bacterium]|jgi:integrase|nr:tyrosine-type recombinase/integrase [Candidatus Baltobacteraceae bacterium]